jgi:hypothetical protein
VARFRKDQFVSRILIPFAVGDISALARSLRDQLSELNHLPGHVEMLHMLARAAGHRNFQSYRAALSPAEPVQPVEPALIQRLARYFDAAGRLVSWPAKTSLQDPCLWVLWSQLPARETLTELELNALLRARHLFGDHALLRRELCDRGLLARTPDGRAYRRVERPPTAEARALLQRLNGGAL